MKRLFIAIALDETAKRSIADILAEIRKMPLHAKIEPVENIHITLKFLGSTEEKKITVINEALKAIADKHAGMTMQLKGFGFFPNVRNPRIFWIGIEEPLEVIFKIQSEVENSMYELGYPREGRQFKAHFTLARIKSNQGINKLVEKMRILSDIVFDPMQVKYFSLYESILKPEGAYYHCLNKYYFKQ